MAVEIKKRLIAVNSLSAIVALGLDAVVLVAAIHVLLQRIPPEEYAILPTVSALMLVISVFQSIFTRGIARYVTEAYARNDITRVKHVVASTACACIIAAVATLAIGLVAASQVTRLLNIDENFATEASVCLSILVIGSSIGVACAVFPSGIFVKQRFVVDNLIKLLGAVLRLVLIFIFFSLLGPRIYSLVLANVLSAFIVLGMRCIYSVSIFPLVKANTAYINWRVGAEVLSFGLWAALGQAAALIRQAADPLILVHFSTPVEVTSMHLGAIVDKQLRQLTITASGPLAPSLTAMHATGQSDRLQNAYLRGGRLALWLAGAVAVPLGVYRKQVLELYLGEKFAIYESSCTVVLLLLLAYPLFYPRKMLSDIAQAKGQISILYSISAATQAFNLLLTLFLVGWLRMEAAGAAGATLITHVVWDPLVWWPFGLTMVGLSWRRYLSDVLVPSYVPLIVASAIGWCLRELFVGNLFSLVINVSLTLLVYLFTIALMSLPEDRRDFLAVTRKVIPVAS